ncbi:MAG: twin-arginine translocase subunit TatB [Alphaproteobacteria bacterium]|nr:MAG: twin-arginine translocase subunit TatB [Alphaproteobacteria bacterium]
MFDIGWTEILIIAVVAIIVVGPKDLPRMLRTLGRYAGKMKRAASDFREQFDDALRESELKELQSTVSDIGDLNPVNQIRDSVTESLDPLKKTAEDIKGGIEKKEPKGDAPAPASGAAAKAAKKAKPSSKSAAASKGGGKRKAAKAAKADTAQSEG